MAKNWTLAEVIVEIRKGTDNVAMQDIGNRFPLTAIAAASNEGLLKILMAIPEKVTARVIETALKDGAAPVEEPTEEKAEEKQETKEPKKTAKPAKRAEPVEEPAEDDDEEGCNYDSMSAKELYDECQKRGIKCLPRRKKEMYIDLLKKNDAENSSDEDDWDESSDEDDWDEPTEEPKKEEKKPEKKAKPAGKKAPAKKPTPEPEDDDEEDWEI